MNLPDALLGFVAAAIPGGGAWFATRSNFTTKVMEMVNERCEALETEVAACRKRDIVTGVRINVLESAVKMGLPELARLDPKNIVLIQVATACRALPDTSPEWDKFVESLSRGNSFEGQHWNGHSWEDNRGGDDAQ